LPAPCCTAICCVAVMFYSHEHITCAALQHGPNLIGRDDSARRRSHSPMSVVVFGWGVGRWASWITRPTVAVNPTRASIGILERDFPDQKGKDNDCSYWRETYPTQGWDGSHLGICFPKA